MIVPSFCFMRVCTVLASFGWLGLSGCGNASGQIDLPGVAATATQHSWKLPKPLREVSGLARDHLDTKTGKGDLVYAIADEQAQIFALNYSTGQVESVFSLGQPPRPGDYEGIAVIAGWIYLITSDGVLLRTRGAADGDSASYETFDLGTGNDCEIEALAPTPAERTESGDHGLWAACKQVYSVQKNAPHQPLRLYHWTMRDNQVADLSKRQLKTTQLLSDIDKKRFSPSGMTFATGAAGTELIIIAARQNSYARWQWSDRPTYLSAGRLPMRHRQAEGLEIGPANEIIVADEGGKKRARLRVYAPGTLF